jgi:mannose-6-phosphate isomerase
MKAAVCTEINQRSLTIRRKPKLQPLFLKPVFKERIWGGTALHKKFGYEIPSDHTGECWAISAHRNGSAIVENSPYAGMALNELWEKNPELFGSSKERVFPLLTKLLDANMDLSVQVHPDDAYANVYENGELGKTECWYIIDCKEDAEIIFGHNAKTKEELTGLMKEGKWNELLRRVKIKRGDFFYVPSGTIHALCEGTLVLETQQSSDTTYRVYDYDRRDAEGNLRELHLERAIEVTTVPYQDVGIVPKVEERENVTITTFVESKFFSVYKWDVKGNASFSFHNQFLLLSVIKGEGELVYNGEYYPLKKGTHFIVPIGLDEFELQGDCELIVSHP